MANQQGRKRKMPGAHGEVADQTTLRLQIADEENPERVIPRILKLFCIAT